MGKKAKERPEHTAPPEIFYDADEAAKYTQNTRVAAVQRRLTERALELLALPAGRPCLLLDLGCGSGLSGEAIAEAGHHWVGLDIAPAMLDVALKRAAEQQEEEDSDEDGESDEDEGRPAAAAMAADGDEQQQQQQQQQQQPQHRPPDSGDLALSDLGHGLPVRQGTFDGAVSISAVQWLCNADRSCNDPRRRMRAFFTTLYRSLRRGGRAVLQIYPEGPQQAEMLVSSAMRAGFGGGLVVDYPHSTRAKKYFLVLMAGGGGGGESGSMPSAKGENGSEEGDSEEMEVEDEDEEGGGGVRVVGRKQHRHRGGGGVAGGGRRGRPEKKSRGWILKKKEQARGRGLGAVRPDTKYTGRKRHKSRK